MKDKSEKWKSKDGFNISIGDCIDSLQSAISVLTKEVTFNNQIKDNPVMKKRYKRKIEVLEMIRNKYKTAELMLRQPTQTIPKKRPEKKSRIIMPGDNN